MVLFLYLCMEITVALVLTLGWRNTRQKFDVAVVLISDVGCWLVWMLRRVSVSCSRLVNCFQVVLCPYFGCCFLCCAQHWVINIYDSICWYILLLYNRKVKVSISKRHLYWTLCLHKFECQLKYNERNTSKILELWFI